jgi:glycosyltransferase involved in cell wall biosynthesis
MTKELITVITVNYNTSDFIEVTLFALAKLTKNEYKVIICDNGSRYSDKRRLKRMVAKYHNVELFFREQSTRGSRAHGEALDILIDKIDTPYGVILDADASFLKKDWDEILINQLDDEIKIIGAPPVKNPIKPTDFPLTYAVLFDTKVFKTLKIDMRPKNPKIGQDTGWEMREKFLENGYQGEVLEVRSTRVYKEGPFRNVICAEYYLEGYDGIFACHFGRGSSLGAAKYKEWNRLLSLPVINFIVRKVKGYKEKKQWLSICREIIKAQSFFEKIEGEEL